MSLRPTDTQRESPDQSRVSSSSPIAVLRTQFRILSWYVSYKLIHLFAIRNNVCMKVIVTLKVVSYWVLHSSQFHVFFSFHLNCFHLKFKNFELNNMVYGVKPALIITYRNFCSGYILGTIACNGNGHECNCINKFRRCRRNLIIIFQSNSTFAFRLLVTYICLVSTTRH